MVEVGGTNLAAALIIRGLVQIRGVNPNLPTGEKANAFVQKLRVLENEAKEKKVGLWMNSKKGAADDPAK